MKAPRISSKDLIAMGRPAHAQFECFFFQEQAGFAPSIAPKLPWMDLARNSDRARFTRAARAPWAIPDK